MDYLDNDETNEDINEYTKEVLEQISIVRLQLEIIKKWYLDDWLKMYDEKYCLCELKYKKLKKKLDSLNSFIYSCIFEPKWYHFCICLRTFFEILRSYLDKDCLNNKNNSELWKHNDNLEKYINLIFEKEKYSIDKKINKLKIWNSYLSEPLHWFPIYYKLPKPKKDNNTQNVLSEINKVINLLIKNNILTINKNNKYCVETSLKFIKNSYLQEFKKNTKK